MGKTWILDTETKGTGAHVVPLESALRRASEEHELATVTLDRPPSRAPVAAPEPPAPLRFKVVDVLSGHELARDIDARDALGLLEHMSSVLDARIYVWMPTSARWRLLTLDEHKLMWRFREQVGSASAPHTHAEEPRAQPSGRAVGRAIKRRSRRSRPSGAAR